MACKSISQSYDLVNSPAWQFCLFSTHGNFHVLFSTSQSYRNSPMNFHVFFFENGRFENFPCSLSSKPCHSQPPPHWSSLTPMWLGEPLRLLRTRAMEELPRNAVLPSEVKGWEWWLGGVNRCEHCKPPWLLSCIPYINIGVLKLLW